MDRRVERPDADARVGASVCPSLDVVAFRASFGLVALECLPLVFNALKEARRASFSIRFPCWQRNFAQKKTSPAQIEVK